MNLFIKWFCHFAVMALAGAFFAEGNHTFRTALMVSLVFVPVAYLADDRCMARYGNFQTAFFEGSAVFGLIVLFQSVSSPFVSYEWAMVAGVLALIVEIVSHRWMIDHKTSPAQIK